MSVAQYCERHRRHWLEHSPCEGCEDDARLAALDSALAGVTPEGLRELADYLMSAGPDIGSFSKSWEYFDRAAAILRALADTIEKTEGKP